jgi:hypothetical protein
LKKEKLMNEITPLIFGITGSTGRVGQGVLEILNLFPHKYVSFEEVELIFVDKRTQSTFSKST